jgi:hypothetical protein
MNKRKTAGELSLKATSDNKVYDPLEIGYALTEDVYHQLMICAEKHKTIFDETEYFVCLFVASDPLIKGIRRHKYAAFLYLPSPRPEQMCCLYNKVTNKLTRLWTLPSAAQMAHISETPIVSKRWQKTKGWVNAFYGLYFWEHIRKEYNIQHLSEYEYLKANRQKLINAGCKECPTPVSEPFDFSKVTIDHIENTKTARSD